MSSHPERDAIASFTRRGVGLAIDSIIEVVPVAALSAAISPGGMAISTLALLVLAQFTMIVAYQTVFIARGGRTVGHRACGLAVVRRVDGGPVGWSASLRRATLPAAVALVPFLGAALVAIVYLRAAFHPLGQGLHDAMAGSVVVRR